MQLTVARIGRAHGLRGEVALDVRSDDPQARLTRGAVLDTDPAGAGPLVVQEVRHQQGRWFVTFAGVEDRTGAEALMGIALVVEADDEGDSESWYRHELIGLRVERVGTHELLGTVVDLEHLPAQDLLVLREPDGAVSRVPFVRQIVPVVDVPGGRVLIDPPGGLLAVDADALVISEETGQDGD
ncbi:MAG: ribosome maturation factor RimM [Cellulomonas sp.]|nr:ribosome maturation factor RimM [Cellulomonas sp.]